MKLRVLLMTACLKKAIPDDVHNVCGRYMKGESFLINKVKWLVVLLAFCTCVGAVDFESLPSRVATVQNQGAANATSKLDGVYRLDPIASDKLYSIISSADTNLPSGRRERFFDDLTVRLSSPDQLAIERRGRRVSIASSRAPRLTVLADGITHPERDAGGNSIRTRTELKGDLLTFSSEGGADSFQVAFEPLDEGKRLRVTRRYSAQGLTKAVIVRSVYDKVSEVPRWNIYEGRRVGARPGVTVATTNENVARGEARIEDRAPLDLRAALGDWIAATNANNIEKQLSFYAPRITAFYLARNVSRDAVREEKERVFKRAGRINISAGDPEVIFDDNGQTAIMRFRKRFAISAGAGKRSGEVVQELRWQLGAGGWKIFSERDVRVIR